MLALVAAGVVAIGIAAGALVLVHHRSATSAASHRAGQVANTPAPVTAAQVATRLSLRAVVAHHKRLVELSFTARRAAGLHSWYAWYLAASPECGSGAGGPSRIPVRAGARVTFDDVLPASCHGTISATVSYFTEAPNADIERSALVGRATLRLP